ncbi:hypothetical protein LPJ78_001220 [Coemansia sp. RSA 989]|nr:transferase family protein [Coemansia mojavensis]KAJ1867129.1 hypothetical protein LPJ78_001220 [Coemansia sp. RSA 989]KAJ1874006.1 hypothetical protein LPJ55_001820 [Coemansia sp. RSA 990]
MDEFIATVESHEVPLHPLDTQAAFLNVPYHFFYPNESRSDGFMPSDVLRRTFYQALKRYPILAGYLRSEGTGKTTVVVDKNDLNMPEYLESTSDVPFSQMQEAKFHNSSWPAGLSTAGAITTAGKDGRIKLANIHVVRMKDNSGVVIFVNIPHYVVDGTGFFSFVELWGTICRAERTADVELKQRAAKQEFCFDRGLISRSLPATRKPLDSQTVNVYTGFSPLADWLAWLSPTTRGRVLEKAKFSSNVVSHTFRVSRDSLKQLQSQVCEHITDDGLQVADTHVLAALISKMVAQAHKKCREQGGQSSSLFGTLLSALSSMVFGPETHQSLNLLADVRHGLDIADKSYMGNGLIPHNTQCPLSVLEAPTNAESLAEATNIVSRIYGNADGPLVASFVDMISARPSCFTRPMVYLARHPTSLVITNETGFKLYKADFGDGLPEWVCTIPSFVANFIGFLPSPPPSTDIVVNITLKAPVMKHILNNEFWRDLATIVY